MVQGLPIPGGVLLRMARPRAILLITRYNKPAAVFVGADWYTRMTGEPVRPEGGAS